MKIAIVNKSDSTGGAAVVSRRLCTALRAAGHDARMIVVEKLTDYAWVLPAASATRAMIPFLKERLGIFFANGFNKSTLFQIDTASDGLPLHKHPFIKEADAICLNWVNQGMLSITGVKKLLQLDKPLIWTMHDMWCMTGVCHHAGVCGRYLSPGGKCGDCPLLGKRESESDISFKTFKRKRAVWNGASHNKIHFVAVSNWLAGLARSSTLLSDAPLSVIHNAFPVSGLTAGKDKPAGRKRRILFGAARIDDPVKGLPVLIRATEIIRDSYPEHAGNLELVTFGSLKNPNALEGIAIGHRHLGRVAPSEIQNIYESADIVVSTSEWETLPGTLIEGQAWGCIPVCLDHGGQSDIVDHKSTGWISPYYDDLNKNAANIAEGIIWAADQSPEIKARMYKSVCDRFSEETVANKYISLIKNLR